MRDPNDERENIIINITVMKNTFLNAHSTHDGKPMMVDLHPQSSRCHANVMENLLILSHPHTIHT